VGLGPARTVSTSAVSGLPIGLTPRNSPTVLNAGYNADSLGHPSHVGLQFWDGRAVGLEEQARGPIASRTEMAGDAYAPEVARDSVIARLRTIQEYVQRFRGAFPAEAASMPGSEIITMDSYGRALAAYQRELVTRNSAFDRYAAGDDDALTGQQKQGLELFFTTGRCGQCHSGSMFSDYSFRVIGVPQAGSGGAVLLGDDVGREEHTLRVEDRHAFRTPSLRNVELTAPYMHDGVFPTLEDVVRFYDAGAMPRHDAISGGALDSLVATGIGMSDAQVAAVVAFLRALTDPGTGLAPQLRTVPAAVPSGLTPVVGVRAP
jgi:cytochrome c peroxidase